MFKKLVPVVTLALFAAGPMIAAAADTTAPADTSASAPAKHAKKHSGHKSKKSKAAAGDSSAAPKK